VGFRIDGQQFVLAGFFAGSLAPEASGSDFIAEEQRAFLGDVAGLNKGSSADVKRLVVERSAAVKQEVEDPGLT
jgi:hypothetical protein